jgi:ABC-type polysaccharide/polyol phosphate transport system ATPase subunit
VADGECVGIVGRNGSGKSTLLQMLAGVTAPSEGSVVVRGRVAPLISVGVGFHQELTGRENVYVNGTILGLSRREIDTRFDEIVEFAEIRPFIDTPVKFYSSGMFVRLGFAVAVTAEPDVLLIDEVLAVGDLAFQIKCFNRMMEIRDKGTTIVVVSHNLNAIRRMCSRSLVVHDGGIRYDGPTDQALSEYHELIGTHDAVDASSLNGHQTNVRPAASFVDFKLLGMDGQPTSHVDGGEKVTFRASLRFEQRVADPLLNFSIISESGVLVYAIPRTMEGGSFEPGQTATVDVAVRLALSSGSYSARLGMVSSDRFETLAPSTAPLLFYVSGRSAAKGLADLDAEVALSSSSPDADAAASEANVGLA